MRNLTFVATVVVVSFVAFPARAADVSVTLKHVHMCCEGCAEEVTEILKKVDGVNGVATDEKTTSAKFTARDKKTDQKALDALAAGGFHGDPGNVKVVAR